MSSIRIFCFSIIRSNHLGEISAQSFTSISLMLGITYFHLLKKAIISDSLYILFSSHDQSANTTLVVC